MADYILLADGTSMTAHATWTDGHSYTFILAALISLSVI